MRVAYLDIETDYVGEFTDQRLFEDFANHRLTVVGILIAEGEADRFEQLVGEEITRERLLKTLEGVKRLVTYNGRSKPDAVKGRIGFDLPVIGKQLGVVLDEVFEHTDLVPSCWAKNLYGGLKKVEQTLGLQRKLPGRDGRWAGQVWREYQKTKNAEMLRELLAYNKEDVYMLREVERALAKLP